MHSGFADLRRRYARATLRASLAASAVVFIVLSLPLAFGLAYYGLDLTRIDLGILCAFEHQLAEGSGLWLSPTLGNGAAFFARPEVGLLYPPRWLALLLPPDIGTSFGAILHLSIAAAATTWLARSFRLRPAFATSAGLCFAFSGTALDLILHSHYIIAAAWLPLVWASVRRLLSARGRPLHTLVLGSALALCLLGGEPQAFMIGSAIVCLEVGQHLWRWRRKALGTSVQIAVIVLAAFAVGMAQWMSTLAELSVTGRESALTTKEVMHWPFHAATWPGVLWPGWAHEHVSPTVTFWHMWFEDITVAFPWNRQPYVGSLFVALAVCGVFLRRARLPVVVMLGGVLLALGDYTPLLPMLTKLAPPLGLFRYPAKYLVIATIAATIVVAIFAQTAMRSRHARRRMLLAGGILLGGQLAFLLAISAAGDTLNRIAAGMMVPEIENDLPLFTTVIRTAIVQSIAPLAVALLITRWLPRLRAAVFGLVVVDLLLAVPSAIMVGPTLEDLRSPMLRVTEPNAVVCVEPNLIEAQFHGQVFSRWGAYSYLRGLPLSELNACDGLASAVPYSPLVATMTTRLERGLGHRRATAARALGCTHMVSREPPVDGTTTPVTNDAEWWQTYERLYRGQVHVIEEPLPRVFAAREPQLVDGHEEAIVAALSRTRDAAGAVAVVDDPMGAEPSPLPDGAGITGVDIDWPVRHRATVAAHGDGGAVIGLRTAFQVGWSAEQADVRLPTVRMSGQHIGAVVSDVTRGPIEFAYTPPRLALGLGLAGLGTAVMAGLAFRQRTRRRRP